jgi:hypothetical protein
MGKRKVNLGGQDFMAEEIEFQPDQNGERWSTYLLHDGTTLKIKAIVADILRIEGQYSPNGDPVYTVNASMIVNTHSPDTLRKKS